MSEKQDIILLRRSFSGQWLGSLGLLLTLLMSQYVFAQQRSLSAASSHGLKFEHLSIEHGLSQNSVNCMLQDRRGFLWIGTDDGLNKFDAYRFTVYKHDPKNSQSLRDNYILCLFEDRAGTLWIGARNGINRFDREENRFTHLVNNLDGNVHPRFNHINAIYEDSHNGGMLWIGTGGFLQLHREHAAKELFRSIALDSTGSSPAISCIYEDRVGMLWFGTWHYGLRRFDPKTQSVKSFSNKTNDPRSLSHNHVISIYEDHAGTLWVGTENGLNQFERETATFTRYQHDLDKPQSLGDNTVDCIYEDRSHTLWIGTERGGLNKYSRTGAAFRNYRHEPNNPRSLSDNEVLSFCEDRAGELWIGTFAGGLNRFDPAKQEFEVYRHEPGNRQSLSHDRVMSIFEDRAGTFWVGTSGGLSRMNREDRKKVIFKNYLHDPDNPLRLSNSAIFFIYEDRAGVLWLGTFAGLERFDRETETFRYYQLDKEAHQRRRDYNVTAIYKARAGNLWIASFGSGLYRLSQRNLATIFPENAAFRNYREQDGLPNNFATGILEDDHGALWISTGNGLAKFNPETETWKKYETAGGLPSNGFNGGACYRNAKGEMFFGGINGFVAFHPDSIASNAHVPRVIISRLSRYNTGDPEGLAIEETGISDRQHLELSYQDNILIFEFAALSYNNPEKNQYVYKLEGFNKNWIQLDNKREATFTNLSPGKYTLLVKGSNSDGVWNEQGASLKITITPPWWKTWWAYALYAVLFIGLPHVLRRYELNRQQYKYRLQLEKVEAEKLKDLDQMKSRFFANISHEFRTPLTLILGQIDSALPAVAERKTKRKLLVAYRNARQLLRLIRQLLDLSKLEAGSMALKAECGNLVGFLKNLVFSFEALAEQKKITLQFHCDREKIELLYDPEKLEMVFYNLLSNAFKFTPEGGRVEMRIAVETTGPVVSTVMITVKDTGIGIPAGSLPHIFDRFYQVDSSHTRAHEGGLALAKELVELHRGEIFVTSEEGVGTAFVVKLPLSASDQFSVISRSVAEIPINRDDQLPACSEHLSVSSDPKIEHHEAMMEDAALQYSINPSLHHLNNPSIHQSNHPAKNWSCSWKTMLIFALSCASTWKIITKF